MRDRDRIRKGDDPATLMRGEYFPLIEEGLRVVPLMCCPGCGTKSRMAHHRVGADGVVNPSVGCPRDCGYRRFVILEQWPTEVAAG